MQALPHFILGTNRSIGLGMIAAVTAGARSRFYVTALCHYCSGAALEGGMAGIGEAREGRGVGYEEKAMIYYYIT